MKKFLVVFFLTVLVFSVVFADSVYQDSLKILNSKHISNLDKTISYYYLFKNRSVGLTHAEPGMMYKENYRLLISMDLHLTNNPDKDLPKLIAYAYHSEPYNYINSSPSAAESLLAFKPYYDYRLKVIPTIFDSYILDKLKSPSYQWKYNVFSDYISYLNTVIDKYRNDGKSPTDNLTLIKDQLNKSGKDYITEIDSLSLSVYSKLKHRRKFDIVSFLLMVSILVFVFDYFIEKKYNVIFASALGILLILSLFTGSLDKFNTFNAISGFTMMFLLLISFIVWINSSVKKVVWYVSLLFVIVLVFSFVSISISMLRIDNQNYFKSSTYYDLYKEHLVGKYSTINKSISFLQSIESKEQAEVKSLIFKSVAGFTRDFKRMGAIRDVKVFRGNIRIMYNRPMKGVEPDDYDNYIRIISNTGKFYKEFLKNSASRFSLIRNFESNFMYKVSKASHYINDELKLALESDIQSRLTGNEYEKTIYSQKVKKILDSSKEHGLEFMPVQFKSGMTFLIVVSWLFISTVLFKRSKIIPMIFSLSVIIVTIFIMVGFANATLFEQYSYPYFTFAWQHFLSSFWLWYVGLLYALIILVITFLKGVHL